MIGDDILILVKGNRNFGNEIVRIREILLDLRLTVNYVDCQAIHIIKVGNYFFLIYIVKDNL